MENEPDEGAFPAKRKQPKENKTKKIKVAKVKGLAHLNHRNKNVPPRASGPDCRLVL